MDWLEHVCADAGKPCRCPALDMPDADGRAGRAGRRLTRALRAVEAGNRALAAEAIRHAAHETRELERERRAALDLVTLRGHERRVAQSALDTIHSELGYLQELAAAWQAEHDRESAEAGLPPGVGASNHDPARLSGALRRIEEWLAEAGTIGTRA